MKRFLTTACFALCLVASTGRCQNPCRAIALAEVQASRADLSLADLLSPDSCAALRRYAAAIRLGAAPLEGSIRVFEADRIRALLEPLVLSLEPEYRYALVVPPRIRVYAARPRSSCRQIEARIFADTPAATSESDCGAAGRIAEDAGLEVSQEHWDPALRSWMFPAHCTRPKDCVPFLIRVPGGRGHVVAAGGAEAATPTVRVSLRSARESALNLLVRPGDKASLLWDQDGVRLTTSAICMDKGGRGDTVRARVEPGHRIVRAVVVNSKVLRVQS